MSDTQEKDQGAVKRRKHDGLGGGKEKLYTVEVKKGRRKTHSGTMDTAWWMGQ